MLMLVMLMAKSFLVALFIILGILFIKVLIDFFGPSKTEDTPVKIKERILSSSTPRKGVQVDVLRQGNGKAAVAGKKVRVHYNAWLVNGVKVDSSYDKGEIFSFTMGKREVIPGWEAGMLGMLEGEKRKFTIDPDQAYGAKGKANVPPNAIIIFEVELLAVI
jgi:FKBP-type peptidyl-prolyl cis-trans isomerase